MPLQSSGVSGLCMNTTTRALACFCKATAALDDAVPDLVLVTGGSKTSRFFASYRSTIGFFSIPFEVSGFELEPCWAHHRRPWRTYT